MPLDAERLLSYSFEDLELEYVDRDVILYALCCGAGRNGDLSLVYEDGLKVIPSFGQNLCFDDAWMTECGVDLSRAVHGGLDLRMTRPLPPAARLKVTKRIAGLTDKGEGRPGMAMVRTDVLNGDEIVFTSLSNLLVMGGGGFGGSRGEEIELVRTPEGDPDVTAEIATRPDAPLFFRLLGDRNPLHVRADVAQEMGFPSPILHGANTIGIVCHDVLMRFCDGDPARMTRFAARFSGPAFPGETLTLSYWRTGSGLGFAARARDRDVRVLDGGLVELA